MDGTLGKAAPRLMRHPIGETPAALQADAKKPASWAFDEQMAGMIWSLHAVYRRAEDGLEFDDLEAGPLWSMPTHATGAGPGGSSRRHAVTHDRVRLMPAAAPTFCKRNTKHV